MEKTDHYCYANTTVLKNKLHIRDQETLSKAEANITAGTLLYLQIHPLPGKFDFSHLKRIHKFIFQPIYSWCGKIRDVDLGKGNLFCRAMFINEYADEVFRSFYSDCASAQTKDIFIQSLSTHYGDLNALHPFREGNGRAQRE